MIHPFAIAAAVLSLALAFTGFVVWLDSRPVAGIVIEKTYREAFAHTGLFPVQCGKIVTMIPRTIHYPDKWSVSVKDGKGRVRSVVVSQAEFNAIERGKFWTNGKAQ